MLSDFSQPSLHLAGEAFRQSITTFTTVVGKNAPHIPLHSRMKGELPVFRPGR